MDHVEYFKLQAKNLFKDYKTRFFDEKEKVYDYQPKYFDINEIFNDFDIQDFKDDFSFSLMNAQHLIAKLAGFSKWNDLLNAKPAELELAHLLFDNAHKLSLEEWNNYINRAEIMNNKKFNAEEKLDVFKNVFLYREKHKSDFIPYRINMKEKHRTLLVDYSGKDSDDSSGFYKELLGNEKISVIEDQKNNSFNYALDEIIECIHCGEKYQFKDVKAVKDLEEDNIFIVCKNYPECDGSIIDFIHVEKQIKK
ncbi:MAG: hypothetical protein J6W62_04035 [Spirochaetia bacterium]|nr:hypothetical protein [Spirochaetia bacterium]